MEADDVVMSGADGRGILAQGWEEEWLEGERESSAAEREGRTGARRAGTLLVDTPCVNAVLASRSVSKL